MVKSCSHPPSQNEKHKGVIRKKRNPLRNDESAINLNLQNLPSNDDDDSSKGRGSGGGAQRVNSIASAGSFSGKTVIRLNIRQILRNKHGFIAFMEHCMSG